MTVTLVAHRNDWAKTFEQERAAFGDAFSELHHIGSTSIPGILAKPIIDMLGAVNDPDALAQNPQAFDHLGYQGLGAFGIEGRLFFRKNDAGGARSHHLHVFAPGSPHIARHLAFRDFLRAHPDIAAAYSDVKAALVKRGVDAEAYMDGKDPFIKRVEAQALDWARAQ
ncbi:MAG: GrpB family protein [Pseudomonadota bacterium]